MGVLNFPRKEALCNRCGATFIKDHPRRILCSPSCRAAHDAELKRLWDVRNRARLSEGQRRRYQANPHPHIERARAYGHSDRGRALQRARSAVRRVTEREKIDARNELNRAIKAGRIKRGACRDCGSIDTHGHHPDYSKPLEVIWLCPPHHIAEHKRIDANG